jgi:hypothetical protein
MDISFLVDLLDGRGSLLAYKVLYTYYTLHIKLKNTEAMHAVSSRGLAGMVVE